MRLIDADALVLKIESLGEKVPIPICTEIINGFQGMVKEAPTVEPTDTDIISRADAIKGIRKCKFESDMPSDWYKGMEEAQSIIKSLPSADAIHNGGVFVPNMEMPKACDYCLFHDSGWSWCKAKDKYCGDDKCPLIAVRGERND